MSARLGHFSGWYHCSYLPFSGSWLYHCARSSFSVSCSPLASRNCSDFLYFYVLKYCLFLAFDPCYQDETDERKNCRKAQKGLDKLSADGMRIAGVHSLNYARHMLAVGSSRIHISATVLLFQYELIRQLFAILFRVFSDLVYRRSSSLHTTWYHRMYTMQTSSIHSCTLDWMGEETR